jgi:hypothetical protein
MISELYYKVLKNTIDNLIDLSKSSEGNTYFLCGIDNSIIDYFNINNIKDFYVIKKTKNGIVLSYKGNHIILQKSNGSILREKPLKEFDIINTNELDDIDYDERI